MPTIVGILTFISMINTTFERLKAKHIFIGWYFSFYEQLKVCAKLSWAWKKFNNLGARLSLGRNSYMLFMSVANIQVHFWLYFMMKANTKEPDQTL